MFLNDDAYRMPPVPPRGERPDYDGSGDDGWIWLAIALGLVAWVYLVSQAMAPAVLSIWG